MNRDLNVFQQQSGFPGGLTPSGPASGPVADGISLSEFLQILRRRAVILQSFVLVTVVAVVLTLMTKPVYRASTRLLVENASISYNAIDTSNIGLVYHLLQAFWFRFLVDAKIMEMRMAAGRSTADTEAEGSRQQEAADPPASG